MAAFSARQARFLEDLRSAIGTPYVWGGNSLQNGVDCSGLVQQAALEAGIRGVPRTSQEQFQHGTPVPMNGLRPGDLIFSNWGSEVGAGHVSIYIGGGKIIEAARPGTNVQVNSINVLAGHIIGARRYLAGAGQGLPNVSAFSKQQLAYHAQQTGGGNMDAAAALQSMKPIQVPQAAPLPTAVGALQNMVAAGQAANPLQTAATPAPAPAGPAVSTQLSTLNTLHDDLLPKL